MNMKKMMSNCVIAAWIVLFSGTCFAQEATKTKEYPRMPDAYRQNGMNKANRNPLGMAIYDAAETAAEEEYFGAEVVSLEESKKILKERKEAKAREKKTKIVE